MFRSIQWRITTSFAVLVLVVMTILGIFLANHVREIQIDSLSESLKNQATVLAGITKGYLLDVSGDGSLASEILRISQPLDERVTVIDAYGVVLVDTDEDASEMENHAGRPEFKEALNGNYGDSTRFSTTLGIEMMYVAVPVISEDDVLGSIRVALPLTEVNSMVGDVITSIIIAIVIAIILVLISGWFITRLFTGPVREVTEATRRMASGELNQRIDIGATDETGDLARTFNQMSEKLSEMVGMITAEQVRLSGILDNIADGVIMTDSEGNILIANQAIRTIFRMGSEELVGRPLVEKLHDHEISELLNICLETGEEQVSQFESDHYKRYIRAIAVPVTGEESGGILLLFQDLTELRALQTMRSELIGNISHDFRTPLAGIKVMVETLRDGAIEKKDVASDFLSRIESEVDRLTQMVAELTELSRIETGSSELKLEPVNMHSLIDGAVNQLKPQAERKNITITIESGNEHPEVNVDKERIQQVLVNLLHNAIKFTATDGWIKIHYESEDNMLRTDIIDNGTGIASKDLPHIFERFYMADRSRSGGGTGMGLAIAKHVIEVHHGRITVKSVEGEGSTFSIFLPINSTNV